VIPPATLSDPACNPGAGARRTTRNRQSSTGKARASPPLAAHGRQPEAEAEAEPGAETEPETEPEAEPYPEPEPEPGP